MRAYDLRLNDCSNYLDYLYKQDYIVGWGMYTLYDEIVGSK